MCTKSLLGHNATANFINWHSE